MHAETIHLYENRPGVTLTTYVLKDSPELLDGQKRPAVLVCPGGAYLGCSDREGEPVALRFNAMGYHAFVLRYSTYNLDHPGFDAFGDEEMEVNPHSMHPSPMRDIGKAFLLLHEHAEEWLVDMDKIALCGFSAGAHNAAMFSVYWDKPVIHEFFGKSPETFKPAATLLAYTLGDYHLMVRDFANPAAAAISAAANFAYLGTKTPDDALLDAVSPARQVSASTPPMFLWATAADTLVPGENTTLLATALAQAKIPFEVHIFEEGPHGLSLADQSTAGNAAFLNDDAAQWVGLAEKWLKKRFALALKPKPDWL
ncbi:MAG: alpha/beta hydrolase [Anaerolineae bacterium]|jgi:acetyl esterase/lipase|nr:alpha/beta hydrolase [Anaerolineae bacterium]